MPRSDRSDRELEDLREIIQKRQARRGGQFAEFGERYWEQPARFAQECFAWPAGEGLTPYQEEILTDLPFRKRCCIRGAHGLGKSALAAFVIHWFALTREARARDWKEVITASVGTQLRSYLWPEVKKWGRALKWDKIGRAPFCSRTELLTSELILGHGRAFCVSPLDYSGIEGAHADELAYIFDEAKAIPDSVFDAAEGAFAGAGEDTGRNAIALVISTPGGPNGRFYQIQKDRERFAAWHPRHVTTPEILRAGRMSHGYVEEKRREWGEESVAFVTRVLGNFCATEESQLIPLAWVEAAFQRWEERREGAQPGVSA